jgi:hypothetical protein
MDSYMKRIAGYLLIIAGPSLGLTNFMVVIYKNFSDQTYMYLIPEFYHTGAGNFMIGFMAMSMVLAGKTLLRKELSYQEDEAGHDAMEVQQI